MRKITKIIIHCAATPEGRDVKIEDIRRWHTNPVSKGGRGWRDIGYHYVIHLDGSVHKGRGEEEIGAHCAGQNACSLGICYVGGLDKLTMRPKDTRTEAQKKSLSALVSQLKRKYPGARVFGHRDFAAKACPCFDASPYNDLV